ncbi:MAG: glycosyltransferase family 4 protein, partial [Candidatus Dojkabacteria bacterium]
MARENLAGYDIKISATEDQVAKLPGAKEFAKYEGLKEIYEIFDPEKQWDLLIYNNFPKNPVNGFGFGRIKARVKASYIAWEEDRFPDHFVEEYNGELDLVLAASEHTRVVLLRSGVKLPILLIPNALDPVFLKDSVSGKQNNTSGFQFLHIGSGLERKAPKELISAFLSEFKEEGDARLKIKSFPNMNNQFPEILKELSPAERGKIEYIDSDGLSETELKSLYLESNAYVSPSKAEGFNLPALEAVACGLPVVATAWSGQMDFLNDENAYLVDYKLGPAKSHLDNPGAFWAEPDLKDLKEQMRAVYENKNASDTEKIKKTAQAYNWEASSRLLLSRVPAALNIKNVREIKLAVVSTYNSVCGIAEYSSYLYSNAENIFKDFRVFANKDAANRVKVDGSEVERSWEYGELDFEDTIKSLKHFAPDVMHIQYSEGFYTLDALAKLIDQAKKLVPKIVLTSHAFQESGVDFSHISSSLKKLDQVQVLNNQDQKFLETKLGLKNVEFIAHGNITFPLQSKRILRKRVGVSKNKKIVAMHGFMSEKKGIMETLEAFATLALKDKDLLLLAINAVNPTNVSSNAIAEQFRRRVQELGLEEQVIHVSDFLEKEEVVLGLALADISVFAYPEAKQTASGAIRLAMAAGRPIIVSDSFQLRDAAEFSYLIENNDPSNIAKGIEELLYNPGNYSQYQL